MEAQFHSPNNLSNLKFLREEKYTTTSHPNSGRNQNIRTPNKLFGNMAKFKYLGMTITYHNDIHDEIKSRLNSGESLSSFSQKSFVFLSNTEKK
jgi:hypothetical protein